MKTSHLGWVVAAAFGGILLGGGFQPDAGKMGVVDITQVIEKSVAGTNFKNTGTQMSAIREDLLQFVHTNRLVTAEQAAKLHDLVVKPTPTPEDKNQIEEIKKQVLESKSKYEALVQKPSPTDDDKKLIGFYADLMQKSDSIVQSWYTEFQRAMADWGDSQKAALIQKARQATQDVGKAQGYTMVFDIGVAPYGANDLTDAAIKAMDAKK